MTNLEQKYLCVLSYFKMKYQKRKFVLFFALEGQQNTAFLETFVLAYFSCQLAQLEVYWEK